MSIVEPWSSPGEASRDAARAALVQTTTLTVEAFPYTIVPNTLITEMRALATTANITVPLVNELAADIFMGAFSATFLHAAQDAARLLHGSLYERYYDIHYEAILHIDDVAPSRYGVQTSPEFGRLCEQRAGIENGRSSPARNGAIIEQAEVLTTHNLAALINALDLTAALRPRLDSAARRCFVWICWLQQMRLPDWRAELKMLKNTAYAWRQMLFFLSLLDQAEVEYFLDWSTSHLEGQGEAFRRRFAPVMRGLIVVSNGDHFDADGYHAPSGARRFLGWSVGRHWLQTENA